MPKFPFIFGRKKLLLAFEYGLILAQVAQEQKVEMTPELVDKAERMIEGEFTTKSASNLACQIVPNIMSAFELDVNK